MIKLAGRTPYAISGTVLDTDGSTALENVNVRVYDVTLGESISTVTDSDGTFVLDLANLVSAYSDGDKLQMVYYAKGKSAWFRHTVDTGTGFWDNGSESLHAGKHFIASKTRLSAYVVANHTASTGQVDFYDVENDYKVLSVEVGANTTSPGYLAYGLVFDGGICVIRKDSTTAGEWDVALVAGG